MHENAVKDELVLEDSPGLPSPLIEQAKVFAEAAKARSTWRMYTGDWRRFEVWCAAQTPTQEALPASPETVALYMTHMAQSGRAVASISRALVSISQRHVMGGYASPRTAAPVREVLKGIRRTLGIAPIQKQAVLQNDLVLMTTSQPDSLLGTRDRALILLGFFAALRRSELVALDVSDVDFVHEGLVVHLRRSKTDQEGAGRKIAVPYQTSAKLCPVRSVRTWLDDARITEGPIFRSLRGRSVTQNRLDPGDVARRIKSCVASAGYDPKAFAGHSLRAGFVTCAAIDGAPERSIAATTGHKNLEMLRRYFRDVELFRDPAAGFIKLRAK